MPFAVATAETDGRLIERVGRGDRDTFEQLYRRFARPVLAMALRQLGDNGRAEDAAQETFAAVWRSARSYRPERGSSSRPGSTRSRDTRSSTERASAAGTWPTSPTSLLRQRGRGAGRVLACLARPFGVEPYRERERVVVELAYWSGLSQTEIMSYLDVPLGTVKTRTRTGLASLGPAGRGQGMTDFRDLVGDDLTPEERAEPSALTGCCARCPPRRRRCRPPPHARSIGSGASRFWTPRRIALVAAVCAALAAASFGVGLGRALEIREYAAASPAADRQRARGKRRDQARRARRRRELGLRFRHFGPAAAKRIEYPRFWLAKDGEYATTCGTFNVGNGKTTVKMSASYRLSVRRMGRVPARGEEH